MEPVLNTQRILKMSLTGLLALLISMAWLPATVLAEGEEEAAAPRMVFSSVTHNAGQVERGAMITHQFTFRNTGGSDLVILSTKAG
jgi:hypothetical protein